MTSLFPFTVSIPNDFIPTFRAFDKETWAECDVTVLSPTRVEFNVYDLKDSYYGGRGRNIRNVSADVDRKMTKTLISKRADAVASEQYYRAKEAKEASEIAKIASRIFEENFSDFV
jgi:hypothetical protein